MKSGVYIVMNEPIAWRRAGANFNRRSLFDTQKPIKQVIASLLEEQHKGRPLYQGPLELIITFFMALPKASKIRQQKLLDDKWHYIKPDASNMLKLMEDICKSILYKDDCQIASLKIQKVYDPQPRTEFSLKELL